MQNKAQSAMWTRKDVNLYHQQGVLVREEAKIVNVVAHEHEETVLIVGCGNVRKEAETELFAKWTCGLYDFKGKHDPRCLREMVRTFRKLHIYSSSCVYF